MDSKSDVLKKIGWSQELINHFMIDDFELFDANDIDADCINNTITETNTICFKFETANPTKIIKN